MSRCWRVDETREGFEELARVRGRLGACDWSRVDWISVRRGRSEKYALKGVCKSPSKGHGECRINCNVSRYTPCPISYHAHVSPLSRNPDGRWPKVPESCGVGDP